MCLGKPTELFVVVLIAVTLMLSVIAPGVVRAQATTDVSALVDKAYALYSQGNYTQAIQYYDKALAIDPNDKHALDGKGNALYNQGNYKQAIKFYDEALAVDPHYIDAIYDKATALNASSSDVSTFPAQTQAFSGQSSNATTSTGVCNSAVCDNSQFKEFAFDKDINALNIHIHKRSGVWHNERGVFVPWSALCNQGQRYLVQLCSELIDSSGTLTRAGDTAVNCITNGAIITIAANTLQLPLSIVKGALGLLAPMTGCDGIVNLDTIQTGPQVQSLLNALSNAASGGQ
jgi:tetratricopeptide (TPR) repeat protein